MSATGNFIKNWVPLFIWMVLIFSASADKASYQHSSSLFVPLIHWLFPQMSSEHVEQLHHLARKCAHLTEYAILALLIRRALVNGIPATFTRGSWRTTGAVIVFVFLYASSDEFHQSFVPGRTALFSDVLIDTTGGTAGLVLAWLVSRPWKKRPK